MPAQTYLIAVRAISSPETLACILERGILATLRSCVGARRSAMRAARPRLAVLLLHACSCVLVEGFALRAAKDPRRGVIQQLFGSSWSGPNILKPLRPSMTKRKETLLRGKIAAKRSFVDQINREIAALDARSCVVTGLERKAHETRVAILRRETDVLERQLVTLRNYLGKVTGYDGDLTRPGLYGVIARGYEKFIATEERSNPNPSPSPYPNPNPTPTPTLTLTLTLTRRRRRRPGYPPCPRCASST